MKIHHIGYAVRKLEPSIRALEKLGYSCAGDSVRDEERKVFIQFMKNQSYLIELVAPMNEAAPVWERLKKQGEGPYHICYITGNLDEKIKELQIESYILIGESTPAQALGNKRVAFLYKQNVGIIELMEEADENTI